MSGPMEWSLMLFMGTASLFLILLAIAFGIFVWRDR